MYELAVFGNPIGHSLSPSIHAQFAQQTGLKVNYAKILAPIDGFNQSVQQFIEKGANGFNVTVPFKLDAFNLATELTLNAKMAGAVNTIKIQKNKLIGENTDGLGLVNDLTQNLGLSLKGKKILILGAGGATQGIILPLLRQQPSQIMVANRTASKAEKLAHNFSQYGSVSGFGLDKIKSEPVDLIINATSASLDGNMPEIASGCADNAICYDLMYGKQTPFMDWAKNNNASIISDGLGMLVEQAASSFEFWTEKKPDTRSVIKKIRG